MKIDQIRDRLQRLHLSAYGLMTAIHDMTQTIKYGGPNEIAGALDNINVAVDVIHKDYQQVHLRLFGELPHSGIDLIRQERERQQEIGYTPDHDTEHKPGTLTAAAICYASIAGSNPQLRDAIRQQSQHYSPRGWPFEKESWKPGEDNTNASRIRELQKAGSLIAAEIDYLQSQATSTTIGTGATSN